MNAINVLQKTYENLYVARIPLLEFLQNRLPVISSQWKIDCIDRILYTDDNLTIQQKNKLNTERKDISQFDIYYLLQVLLEKNNWNLLKEFFPEDAYYFDNKNKELYYEVRNIRCTVMHPSLLEYNYEDYIRWENIISNFVDVFSPNKSLQELRREYHQIEKEKLLNLILINVINPALASDNLSEDIKLRIINTKDRLEKQNTAEGIIAFFTDALDSLAGKEIAQILEINDLKSFEKIKDEILKEYYK